MLSNCTFFVHSAPLTYCNLVPATPRHEYTITSRAHATVLTCTTEVPPFLQTSVVLFYNGQDSLSDRNVWDSVTVTIQKNTVRITSTDARAQHYVEIVSLSIRSYSLGATHCVAIHRLTTYTSEP